MCLFRSLTYDNITAILLDRLCSFAYTVSMNCVYLVGRVSLVLIIRSTQWSSRNVSFGGGKGQRVHSEKKIGQEGGN